MDCPENAANPEVLRKTARALKALSQCCRVLVRAHDELELLTEVCQIVVGTAGYRLAWVGLAQQDDQQTVRPVAQAGFEDGYLQTVNVTWADTERRARPPRHLHPHRPGLHHQEHAHRAEFSPGGRRRSGGASQRWPACR